MFFCRAVLTCCTWNFQLNIVSWITSKCDYKICIQDSSSVFMMSVRRYFFWLFTKGYMPFTYNMQDKPKLPICLFFSNIKMLIFVCTRYDTFELDSKYLQLFISIYTYTGILNTHLIFSLLFVNISIFYYVLQEAFILKAHTIITKVLHVI